MEACCVYVWVWYPIPPMLWITTLVTCSCLVLLAAQRYIHVHVHTCMQITPFCYCHTLKYSPFVYTCSFHCHDKGFAPVERSTCSFFCVILTCTFTCIIMLIPRVSYYDVEVNMTSSNCLVSIPHSLVLMWYTLCTSIWLYWATGSASCIIITVQMYTVYSSCSDFVSTYMYKQLALIRLLATLLILWVHSVCEHGQSSIITYHNYVSNLLERGNEVKKWMYGIVCVCVCVCSCN